MFRVLTCSFFMLLLVSGLVYGDDYRGHCADNEDVVFACEIGKNGKILSLCKSHDFDGYQGYLQYRYGKSGDVEMLYPENMTYSGNDFTFSRYTRALVSSVDVTFKVNDVQYDVYDYYNAEGGVEEYSSGVMVILPDDTLIDIPCGPNVVRNIHTVEEFLPQEVFE